MEISDLSIANECLYMKINLAILGICFKLAPCISMLMLSVLLLQKMDQGKQSASNSTRKDTRGKIDRSSSFIQFVLIVFLITEFPQGVFNLLGALSIVDYLNYYQNLSIFMNVLSFFNTTTSFIIYSALSEKFRRLFVQLFLPKRIIPQSLLNRRTLIVQFKVVSTRLDFHHWYLQSIFTT